LSVTVTDKQGGNVIGSLSPPPVLDAWAAWKVPLPRREMEVEIVADDQGSGWGQWMAVGMPFGLK
jgi:hypothetical protein